MDDKIVIGSITVIVALLGLYFQYFHRGRIVTTYPTSCMICQLPSYGILLLLPISISNPGVKPFRVDGFFLWIAETEKNAWSVDRPMWQWYLCNALSPDTKVELGTSMIIPPRSSREVIVGFSHDEQSEYFEHGKNRISFCILRPDNEKRALFTFDLYLSDEQMASIRSGKPLPASRTIWWENVRGDKLPALRNKWWNKMRHERVYSFQPHDPKRKNQLQDFETGRDH